MATEVDLPNEELIYQLFQHLGIQQAHIAASMPADWMGFAASHPECISSLTLLSPRSIDPSAVAAFTSRFLVITGDRGRPAEALRRTVSNLPGATLLALRDYPSAGSWLDIAADRTEEIGLTMMNFLARVSQEQKVRGASPPEGEGEVAGISYRVTGSGPLLLLFPLALALSQWEPLVPKLKERFCTITLRGAKVGQVAVLEERA
ncbi:MAG: alpha/beta fold hydrolase, partial [Anaerolineae bacterium]